MNSSNIVWYEVWHKVAFSMKSAACIKVYQACKSNFGGNNGKIGKFSEKPVLPVKVTCSREETFARNFLCPTVTFSGHEGGLPLVPEMFF